MKQQNFIICYSLDTEARRPLKGIAYGSVSDGDVALLLDVKDFSFKVFMYKSGEDASENLLSSPLVVVPYNRPIGNFGAWIEHFVAADQTTFDPSLLSDMQVSGTTETGRIHETNGIGTPLCKRSDGYYIANSFDPNRLPCVGLSLSALPADNGKILSLGYIKNSEWTFAPGFPVYLDSQQFTQAPSTQEKWELGYGYSVDTLFFKPIYTPLGEITQVVSESGSVSESTSASASVSVSASPTYEIIDMGELSLDVLRSEAFASPYHIHKYTINIDAYLSYRCHITSDSIGAEIASVESSLNFTSDIIESRTGFSVDIFQASEDAVELLVHPGVIGVYGGQYFAMFELQEYLYSDAMRPAIENESRMYPNLVI